MAPRVPTCRFSALSSSRHQYSANRLLAFRDYCASTSRLRVFFVLLLYCTPGVAVILLFDVVPLRDPSEGWRANGVFWMRLNIGSTVAAVSMLVLAQFFYPESMFTQRQVGAIAVATGFGYMAALMLLAHCWRFPVPFSYAVGSMPMMLVLTVLVIATLGTADRKRLVMCFKFSKGLCLYCVMMILYPTYNVVFMSLKGNTQLVLVLLLPIIKVVFKRITTAAHPVDDDVKTSTEANVDIFDALYMTKCMQSGSTLVVGVGIIAVDTVHNVVAIRNLAKQTQTLVRVKAALRKPSMKAAPPDLLTWLFGVLQTTERLGSLSFRDHASYTHSEQSQAVIRRLRSLHLVSHQPDEHIVATARASAMNAIVPAPQTGPMRSSSLTVASSSDDAIHEALKLLHLSELVVVVEYIEVAVPVMYAIYMVILFHLPNAKYYQDMKSMTESQLQTIVLNILAYALMEFLSLVYVHRTLRRQFGISALYQLAFALETDAPIFQCAFLSWALIVFQFLLAHNGADFGSIIPSLTGS